MSDNDQDFSHPLPGPGPEEVAPEQPQESAPEEEGVKTGNLVYTEMEDGLRNYPAQQPVETTEDPAPTPAQ